MPTINIKKKDLESLTGISLGLEDIEHYLQLVKGELKGYDPDHDDIRVELNDSNRPDLWSSEGIARQIRGKVKGEWGDYHFFYPTAEKRNQILVEGEMRDIRPYVGGFTATGITVDEEILVQMIQTQEKISEIFGSKRKRISIGIYNLSRINFPVYYRAVRPDEYSFIPLGFEEKMTLDQIIERHPKGQAYGEILKGFSKYPLLADSKNSILSFPPIINSREVGEVKSGDSELFIEVTGLDMRLVLLVLNILAVNLFDRGASINSVEVVYPYDTDFGREVVIPYELTQCLHIPLIEVEKVMGEPIGIDEVSNLLDSYGHWVLKKGNFLEVTPPPYRDDIMHSVDICEDIAISRGYSSFSPVMPSQMTVGSLSEIELFTDLIRGYLVGLGFQEVISNILTSRVDILDKMGLDDARVIEVDNVMSLSYSVLRHWLIPSLLRVESGSTESFYPHRTFETGEVAMNVDGSDLSGITRMKAAALISHPSSNFSEAHSVLESLMYYLQIEYRLVPGEHPSSIEGRMGWVYAGEEMVGLIGEVHPRILTRWDIHMPCSAFELDVDRLLKIYKTHP